MKVNCLIVDDEPLARKLLAAYVEKIPQLQLIGQCANALEAQLFLEENEQPVDLLLLDIQMPDLTGLDFLKSIPKQPLTIFTTAYSEYALQGFELNALDYLVKPIAFDRFFKAIHKAIKQLRLEKNAKQVQEQAQNLGANNTNATPITETPAEVDADRRYIFVKSDYKIVKVRFKEILFIQSLRDYVCIQTNQDKIITLQSISKLEEILPPQQFFRIHRSYIINIDKIDSIEGNSVRIGNHQLTVSKRQKKDFLDLIDKDGLI